MSWNTRRLAGSSTVWPFETAREEVRMKLEDNGGLCRWLVVSIMHESSRYCEHYGSTCGLRPGGVGGKCACVLWCYRTLFPVSQTLAPPQLHAWCFPAVQLSGGIHWTDSARCQDAPAPNLPNPTTSLRVTTVIVLKLSTLSVVHNSVHKEINL